jgi:hypothetical protein
MTRISDALGLTRLPYLVLISAVLVFFASCTADIEPVGPARTETQSIPLDKAEIVRVELNMGAGELRLKGGSPQLMDAEFRFNRPSLKPQVRYEFSGFRGHLTVDQPAHHGSNNLGEYSWDLRLNDDKPVDLNVHFGAGEARLEAGSLALRSVEINMGVGELRLDLRGTPKRDYDVNIRGGVGEATVYLPLSAGIIADASGGIGGIQVRGLHKSEGHYVNDAYGHANATIRVDVRGGVGAINLFAE